MGRKGEGRGRKKGGEKGVWGRKGREKRRRKKGEKKGEDKGGETRREKKKGKKETTWGKKGDKWENKEERE